MTKNTDLNKFFNKPPFLEWPTIGVPMYPPDKPIDWNDPEKGSGKVVLTPEQEAHTRKMLEDLKKRYEEEQNKGKTITKAVKYDEGKLDWTLLPIDAVEEIIKVLMFGASKYSPDNWKEGGGFNWRRVWKSLTRHIFSWFKGEDNDPESGLSHLAHAGCCILFLLHYVLNKDKFSKDDR